MAVLGESRLGFDVEWEAADEVTTPELAATWCRLRINVNGTSVTSVEDTRTRNLRRGVYSSAYPLAEWIAEHWWQLITHARPSAVDRRWWSWDHVISQSSLKATSRP
jgi:hypothetical protein